jgi:hypothetical protein
MSFHLKWADKNQKTIYDVFFYPPLEKHRWAHYFWVVGSTPISAHLRSKQAPLVPVFIAGGGLEPPTFGLYHAVPAGTV